MKTKILMSLIVTFLGLASWGQESALIQCSNLDKKVSLTVMDVNEAQEYMVYLKKGSQIARQFKTELAAGPEGDGYFVLYGQGLWFSADVGSGWSLAGRSSATVTLNGETIALTCN